MNYKKMWINKKGDKLTITFNYDQKIVKAVRTISGRKWNKDLKRWEAPLEAVDEVCEVLEPLGFQPHRDVKDLLAKRNKWKEDVKKAKKSPDLYDGDLPLYDFQKKGAGFMSFMDGVLLGDVPGLGKTLQTIGALEDLPGPFLVFVPASLKYSWQEEIEKWEKDSKTLVIDGGPEIRKDLWSKAGDYRWVILNYELLLRDFEFINAHPWTAIVCDEATRISNPRAKTTKALKKVTGSKMGCKRFALTGTPISNSPEDVYSLIDWIQPGYLGNYWQFRDTYCVMDEKWGGVVGFKNMDKLSDKIEPLMLRRTKEEVLEDFPPKTVENISFNLSDPERHLYQSIKYFILEELNKLDVDTMNLPIIPVKMLRLKQTTDDPRLVVENNEEAPSSSKLAVLKDLLKPVVEAGEKAIIFTQFAEMLKLLMQELSEYKPAAVYGDVDSKQRMEAVQRLKEDPDTKVIIMTEAGAYGLNIQHATYVIHYDAPWSIAKLMQREDRSHRIGQCNPVTVYNLIAKDTIDEYVAKVLHKKQKTSVKLLKDFERLEEKGLSKEDIEAILRL